MALFDVVATVTVGESTKKLEYDQLRTSIRALAGVGIEKHMGGDHTAVIDAAALAVIPGYVRVNVPDCSLLDGLRMDVQFMGYVAAGSGFARLRNQTAGAYIGAETAFTSTTPALVTIASLTIPASGSVTFELHARYGVVTDAPVLYGARLLFRLP